MGKLTNNFLGLINRFKTLYKRNSDMTQKYRIKKRYVRFIFHGVKFSFLGFFVLLLNKKINYINFDQKYDEIIQKLEKLKDKEQVQSKFVSENFYKDFINNKSDISNILRFVEMKPNDKPMIFYSNLINFIMNVNKIDNSNLDLHVVKYYYDEKINEKIYKLTKMDINQIMFGISIYGGKMILNENILFTKKNFAELYYIVALNMALAFKIDINKKIRVHNIEYLIKIAQKDKKNCIIIVKKAIF